MKVTNIMALGYYSGGEFRAMIKLAHTWISRCVAEAYPNWPNADYTWVLAPIAAATSSARTKIICFLPSKLMISCYPVNHPKCSMHGTRLSMKGEFDSRPQYACPVHAEQYFLVFFFLLSAILPVNPSFACNLEFYRSSSTTLHQSLCGTTTCVSPRTSAASIFHLTRNQGRATGILPSLYFTSWPSSAIYIRCSRVKSGLAEPRYLSNLTQQSLIYF